jgi:hypothetical protein
MKRRDTKMKNMKTTALPSDGQTSRKALCGCCIRAIQSRGEAVYIGDLLHDEEVKYCAWCKEENDELYAVRFEQQRRDGSFLESENEDEDEMEI